MPSTVRSALHELLRRAGLLALRFHDLRHTAASLMLADEALGLQDVKAALGHSSIAMTSDRYGHVLVHRQEVIAAHVDHPL